MKEDCARTEYRDPPDFFEADPHTPDGGALWVGRHHLLHSCAGRRSCGIDGARRRSRASLALACPIGALAECMSRITLAIFDK